MLCTRKAHAEKSNLKKYINQGSQTTSPPPPSHVHVHVLIQADLLDSSLGLADHHKQLVVDYLRLARFRRTQCVKTIDLAFEVGRRLPLGDGASLLQHSILLLLPFLCCLQDLAGSRLVEGTFTCEEVREMLSGLSGAVRADVESELITTAHTNALLLREVFADAEKWHLKLQADINQLETRYVVLEEGVGKW